MSTPSNLDPDALPGRGSLRPPGHDTGALGPSDLSDTGSDSVGQSGYDEAILSDTGDSVGTGVDASPIEPDDGDTGHDIGFDRVVRADEAGLGAGLDQAEEARHGVTDEALDPVDEAGAALDPGRARAGPASRRRRWDGAGVEAAGTSATWSTDALPDDDAPAVDDPDDAGEGRDDADADDPDAR